VILNSNVEHTTKSKKLIRDLKEQEERRGKKRKEEERRGKKRKEEERAVVSVDGVQKKRKKK
jgi:hypothetical protein